jgi:hypothetical protein
MLYRPTETSQGRLFVESSLSAHTQFSNSQHGFDSVHLHSEQQLLPRLLAIPSESLTHITAFLDPPSLLALARVCKVLYQHVQNDSVWHRAFICQFLGVSPETDLQSPFVQARSRLLRRSHKAWRGEFISRYNLKRCVTLSFSLTDRIDGSKALGILQDFPYDVFATSFHYF